MFCTEDSQRDCEAQVGQGYHLVDSTSPDDVVLRGQQTDRKQREAGCGHRERGAQELKEYGENGWLHGLPKRHSVFDSTSKSGLRPDWRRDPTTQNGQRHLATHRFEEDQTGSTGGQAATFT